MGTHLRWALAASNALVVWACGGAPGGGGDDPGADAENAENGQNGGTALADLAEAPPRATCPAPPPGPGTARARVLACPEELPQGLLVAGQVGDLVLENQLARFVVRTRQEGHALLGLAGGGLVDAVRLGAGGEQVGEDGLLELAIAVDFHVLAPTAVQIAGDDGTGDARVVVEGQLVPHPTLQAYLPLDKPAATVTTEYRLRPDRTDLEIHTRITPAAGAPASVIVGDIGFWGGDAALYVPGIGASVPGGLVSAQVLGFAPLFPESSLPPYALAADRPRSLIDAGGIVGFLDMGVELPPEGVDVVRWLAVGQTDLASVMASASTSAGLPVEALTGKVSGTAPSVDVEVADAEGGPLTRCRPDPLGAFACSVPPGAAQARALWLGNGAGAAAEGLIAGEWVAVVAGQPVALTARVPAWLHVTATDPGGAPLPFKLTSVGPTGGASEERTVYEPSGEVTLALAAGEHQLWVNHGPEWSQVTATRTLVAGEVGELSATLAHAVETPGWVAADFHVHAELSSDSNLPNAVRMASALGEGLEYLVSTDHDFVTDYRPWLEAAGLEGRLVVANGVESSTLEWGHFNSWPRALDPDRVGNGAPGWDGLELGELFSHFREGDPARIVQCNHPRFQDKSLFDALALDPLSVDLDVLQCDTLEVINGIGHADTPQVLDEWIGLLRRGRFIPATGVSDSHGVEAAVGSPRTLVFLGLDASGKPWDSQGLFTAAEVDAALREGHALATGGPFLTLEVLGPEGQRAGIGDTLGTTQGTLLARAVLEAPEWMALGTLELRHAGIAVATQDLQALEADGGKQRVVLEASAEAQDDTFWIAVHVPGETSKPGLYKPPWAVTNPVFYDGDGDGVFSGTP